MILASWGFLRGSRKLKSQNITIANTQRGNSSRSHKNEFTKYTCPLSQRGSVHFHCTKIYPICHYMASSNWSLYKCVLQMP